MPGKKHLDKAAVIGAAVDLLNREGAESLTLNRLAALLDIQPPSLYNHIQGMPGLMRDLAVLNASQIGERMAEAAIGYSGEEGLMRVGNALRGYIKDNPGLYLSTLRSSGTLAAPDPALQAAEDRALRVVLTMLASSGISGSDAVHVARGLRSAVHGFATLEIAGGFGIPIDLDESFRRLVRGLISGLFLKPDLKTDPA